MAGIRVESNMTAVSARLSRLFADQVPFATQKALNRTATEFQTEQRTHQRDIFTVRRPSFVDRAVKVRHFAKKTALFAEVAIDPPGGRSRADVIAKFEADTVKEPIRGRRLAVPQEAKRTASGVIRRDQRPRALRFRPHGRGPVFSSRTNVMVGDRRTVMIRRPGGKGVILQRVGRGRSSELRPLFIFTPKAKIDPELAFTDNAVTVGVRRFPVIWDEEFQRAIETAR